ncbi:MAG: 6-carboxytetrahydropterin synthase [Cytophagales bacterium]|nr:6-carboxytetrahydropterin synthase [Cytophagales bacterium]
MKSTVCRKERFNAAHRLYNPVWSKDENDNFYGKCANEYYHGHNYELIVKVTGTIDENTGYVIDMKYLSDIIKSQIIEKFDHKNLNIQVDEFKTLIPTAENIAVICYNLLKNTLGADYEIKIVLYETERNFIEYPV